MQKKKIEKRIHFTSAFFDAIAVVDAKKLNNPFWFYPGRWLFTHGGDTIRMPVWRHMAMGESPSSFPGFSLFLRERKIELKKVRTLVVAGHVAPKIWELKLREGKKSLVINDVQN